MPTTILDGETLEQARARRFRDEAALIENAPAVALGQLLHCAKGAAHLLAEIQALGVLLGERKTQALALRARLVATIAAIDREYYGGAAPTCTPDE